MRILVITTPQAGHVNPMTALVKGLISRNHQITWYTDVSFKQKITVLGAQFSPFKIADVVTQDTLASRFPERNNLKGLAQMKFDFNKIFLDCIKGQVIDLLSICDEFKPDLLLADSGSVAPIIIKHRYSLPLVYLNFTALTLSDANIAPFGTGMHPSGSVFGKIRNRILKFFIENIVFRKTHERAKAILHEHGLPPLKKFFFDALADMPDILLQPTSPAFEYPRQCLPSTVHFIGPILPEFPSEFIPPSWWAELNNDIPVILVTQGTVTTNPDLLIKPTIRALSKMNVLVIVTTSDTGISELGALPPNVRAEKFIPYNHLLPYVDVIITNGGYGTVNLALSHGIPLVVAGRTEEKVEIGARVSWSGAGINLRTDCPSPEMLKKTVKKIINTSAYRKRANEIKDDFKRYNAVQRGVEIIESVKI